LIGTEDPILSQKREIPAHELGNAQNTDVKPSMNPTIRPWLQLIRLPNVVTAAADSLAGCLLATGSLAEPGRWLPLTAASMVLYASGTALNDVFDFEIDRAERPNRPLPSGQVARRTAAWFGGLGLVVGTGLACMSGAAASGIVAAILALCILGYDAGLKHTWLGPVFMGACRGLNLLLGMSYSPALAGPIAWFTATVYGLYVAGITVVSRSETSGGRRDGLIAGLALEDLAILGLAGVTLAHGHFPHSRPDKPLIPLEGLLVLALVALAVNSSASKALAKPIPQLIQKNIKTSLLALVWLHVGVIAGVRGVQPAALVALLWVPAFILGRWLYST
jgi:4-hydroxybenzoate polyprenyltransferase